MTISTNLSRETFAVNGPRLYTYTKELDGADSIVCYEEDAGGLLTLIDDADLTITVAGDPPLYVGGTVQFLNNHDVDSVNVIITRSISIEQLVNYLPYSRFPSETHEFALDKLTMIMQDVEANILDNAVLTTGGQWVDGFKIFRDGLASFLQTGEGAAEGGYVWDTTEDGGELYTRLYPFSTYTESKFSIEAYGSGATIALQGNSDGTLTWNGNEIAGLGGPSDPTYVTIANAQSITGKKTFENSGGIDIWSGDVGATNDNSFNRMDIEQSADVDGYNTGLIKLARGSYPGQPDKRSRLHISINRDEAGQSFFKFDEDGLTLDGYTQSAVLIADWNGCILNAVDEARIAALEALHP